MTESQPINAFRGLTTNIANFFGNKGFDNPIFDYTRNEALQKLKKIMENKKIHKICNLRMDVDNSDKSLFVINLFGTALRKTDEEGSDLPNEDADEEESPKEDEEDESPKEDEEESPKEDEEESPKEDEEDESASPKEDEDDESASPKEDEEDESESPKEDEETPNDEEETPKEEDVDTPKTWRPKN